MKRRDAREAAFLIIFELSFKPDEQATDLLAQTTREERLEHNDYLVSVISDIQERLTQIDKKIETQVIGWKKSRISRVSLAVLRLAIYEMDFVEEISDAIAINEAVEIAKKFEGEEAASFVNGLLGALAKSKQPTEG